jgi:LacI family transcriptional regulator
MVRLKDIAERAGVSAMTVSKALRDAPDVSEAMQARIKLLAEQMGYVPDSTAQGLRTRTTKLFGVILPALTHPIFARVGLAIEERARELGYDLLVAQSLNTIEREEVCIRRFLSRRVDGLLIAPVYRMEPQSRIYQELLARRTPVVLLGPPAPFCASFTSVDVDDVAATQAATEHLLQFGHTAIAFLCGPLSAPWAQARFEGYRRALRAAGRDVDERLVFQAGSTIEDGVKAALQMMNESCKATAVQAAQDLVAIGCADTFLNQGIRIPQDVSVLGFGNIMLAEYFRVQLTTVRQPKFRLGVQAVDTMMQVLRGQAVESKRLPGELIVRASTAAVKTA